MIKVFNPELTYVGDLDIFESFQCSVKYADAGSFTIKSLITPETTELLKVGNFIYYKKFAGYIVSIQENVKDGKETITATGNSLEGLLERRIIMENRYYKGKSEDFLRDIVKCQAIQPNMPERALPFLTLGEYHNLPQVTERNTEHETLLHECSKVCSVAEYGFKVSLDIRQKKMFFEVYQGADRTAGKPNQIIIGRGYDNVEEQEYIHSIKDMVNAVLVEADKRGSILVEQNTNDHSKGIAAGLNRIEKLVKSTKDNGELTSNQYLGVLEQEGREHFKPDTKCIDAEICNVSDLEIGDKVSIIDKAWNIKTDSRIEEIQTTVQRGMEVVSYILGKDIVVKEKYK